MFRRPNYERQSRIIFVFWEWENVILRFPELRAIIPFSDLKDEINELGGEIDRIFPYENIIHTQMKRFTLQNTL